MNKKVLDYFKKTDPVLYSASKGELVEIEVRQIKDYFLALCSAIVSQQLSGKAAATIFERFKKLFPKEIVTPEKILKLPQEKLRAVGLSNAKANYLRDLADKVVNKEVHLEKLNDMSNEEVIDELVRIKGIGRWTAEMFLMFSLGREDVFSAGDLGLKNAIKRLYKMDNPAPEQLETLSLKWSPYRTYACLILWRSLDNR